MSAELETASDVKTEGLAIVLPPHLTENFAKAQTQISELYGRSPDLSALIRLWIACGTSWRVRREFERAVLDLERRTIHPAEDGSFDEDCL